MTSIRTVEIRRIEVCKIAMNARPILYKVYLQVQSYYMLRFI